MQIIDYLKKHNMTQKQFAELLGVTSGLVNQWILGNTPVSIVFCVRIEKLTNGEVSRKDLRPSDWHEIWPELADAA